MNSNDREQLKTLAKDSKTAGKGARIRRALLTLAIPATAALATACYGVPMAEAPYGSTTTMGPTIYLDGVDCDADGIPESASAAQCHGNGYKSPSSEIENTPAPR